MTKFRIICPECGHSTVAQYPRSMLWERCPACRRHIWDEYDALMAERYVPGRDAENIKNLHADN